MRRFKKLPLIFVRFVSFRSSILLQDLAKQSYSQTCYTYSKSDLLFRFSLIDSASKCSFILESFLRVEVKSLVLDTCLNNNNDCVHYIETTTSQGM